jgi:hypothetical protein
MTPPTCGTKDCYAPCQQFTSGAYATQCAEHKRASVRKAAHKRRWQAVNRDTRQNSGQA